MPLSLTPERIAAVYECLRAFPQFRRCPPADEVEFHIIRMRDRLGDYELRNGQHVIRVSSRCVGHWNTLGRVMAHEMLHLLQVLDGTANAWEHNADFERRGSSIARIFGWDERAF